MNHASTAARAGPSDPTTSASTDGRQSHGALRMPSNAALA